MLNWIEQKSAELKAQKTELEKKARQEKKAELHKQALGAMTVDELEMAVRHDIARWNELNPGYRRRIDGVMKLQPSGAFRVYKSSFPPASVEAVLDPESFCVTVETTRVRPGEKEQHTDRGHFILTAAKQGFWLTLESGKAVSFADASQVLLEPIIESMG